MMLTYRGYQNEDDYWRIRAFLRRVFFLNDRREKSWQAYRFDYWRWHGVENMSHGRLETDVFLWETETGEIAAVLNREGPGHVFLHIQPGLQTPELVADMLAIAEERLAVRDSHGNDKLTVWTHEQERVQQGVLTSRSYTKGDELEHQRRRLLSQPIQDWPIPEGYTVRALRGADELPARSYVSWQAFHPDEPDDKYQGWDWYQNIQRAPLYRRDLDIVAVAPDGTFASFCTVWFDDVTRTGAFEPVGTAPAHQRRGLGKAVMGEGLRRLKQRGATLAYVGSYEEPAHSLYASVGFTEYDLSEPWTKRKEAR